MGMGKLNYTNRKSDGVKLGAIVAKDLRKKCDSYFKRPVDERPNPTPLELCLAGKNLTDEGFKIVAEAILEALRCDEGESCFTLEELNISNNKLTTASLRFLVPIVEKSQFDLKDLDVSENNIRVHTTEEANDWEAFLQAFCYCRVLRRIDFHGSDFSKATAFEILTRVYGKHQPIDPNQLEPKRQPSTPEDPRVMPKDERASNSLASKSDEPETQSEMEMAQGTILSRQQGLRSVPYLIFSDVKMDDAGALWFSVIIEHHYYPQYLMSPLKNGPVATLLQQYEQNNHCWGLVHTEDADLSANGKKLIEQAEKKRASFLISDEISELSSSFVQAMPSHNGARGDERRMQNVSSDDHPSSMTNSPDADTNALEHTRKKLQRTTLEGIGHRQIQLWFTAVQVIGLTRTLLLCPNQTSEQENANTPTPQSEAQVSSSSAWGDYNNLSRPTIDAVQKSYSSAENACGFPTSVWLRIIAHAANPQGILNARQFVQATTYARARSTLRTELTRRSKGQALEIWSILRESGCLTYDIKL